MKQPQLPEAEGLYSSLAYLKDQKKKIEAQIKEIEKWILVRKPLETYKSEYGTLSLRERVNLTIPDNKALLEQSPITQEIFNLQARISPGVVRGIVGERTFGELMKEGVVQIKDRVAYYELKK